MKNIVKKGSVIIFALFCIIYPILVLIVNEEGFLHWQFFDSYETRKMFIELLIIGVLCGIGYKFKSYVWLLVVFIIFSYLHMMILPLIVAIMYLGLTFLLGMFVNKKIMRYKKDGKEIVYFLEGIMSLTILYAVLSFLKIGSIRNILCFDIFLFILLIIFFRKEIVCSIKKGIQWNRQETHKSYLQVAIIMIFLCIAVGRANISLDYDSVWYGLRTPYVLNVETGIYDIVNMVGTAYTYPKGFEIFVMPLSDFESYGFIYACNIVMLIGIIYVAYKIFRNFLEHKQAMWLCVLLSAIPGIVNMSITAKSDIMTLLMQVITIYFCFNYLKSQESSYLWLVIASYVYTQTLKTTAVLFSTTIIVAFLFVCLVNRVKLNVKKGKRYLLLSILSLGVVWLRTYILTGIPAASIWGWFFRAIGMEEKYPYATGQILQVQTNSLFSEENVMKWLNRLQEFFFAPNSSDTDHIIIAWGTTLLTFLFFVFLIRFICSIKEHTHLIVTSKSELFMALLAVGEFVLCILILFVGVKPDGNYFMLMYFSVVMCGGVYLMRELSNESQLYNNMMKTMLGVILVLNVVTSSTVNWAWASNFSPIALKNSGYYNHVEEFEYIMYNSSCEEFYDEMTSDSTNRVLAYGEHPLVERIPCMVESDLDINFWGNSELMSTEENFLEFVEYIDYDYIFIWNGYLKEETQDYKNVAALISSGKVKEFETSGTSILITLGDEEISSQNGVWLEQLATICE